MGKNILVLLAATVLLATSCQTRPQTSSSDTKQEATAFKSIIRLWPIHHTDSLTLAQTVDAFRQYRRAVDEVWFCVPYSTFDLDFHRREAQLMAHAAEEMRQLGIVPGIQNVVMGHPEASIDYSQPGLISWGAIMSIDGQSGRNQSCPRQEAFRKAISEIQAIYAQAVQPAAYMLDDDLRITAHAPADAICFCDTCMAQFNALYSTVYTRETLSQALLNNADNGEVRRRWIAFSQEGIADVARAIARRVNDVSPHTRLGLQHPNFHTKLMEGYDWNKIFNAMEEETGQAPASRPGHGFYNDAAPRGMLEKGFGIARQIRRLNPNITAISPEIEGYLHKATGKSAQGICTETMLYLSMGATQMSYAIMCSGQEPVEWYASTYLKFLDRWKDCFSSYVNFNQGTQPGGLDAYISPNHVLRPTLPGENPWGWTTTSACASITELATIGLPFAPESAHTCATYIDGQAIDGTPDDELRQILRERNLFIDQGTWRELQSRLPDETFAPVETPAELQPAQMREDHSLPDLNATAANLTPQCFTTTAKRRIAVIPAFTTDLNNAERRHLLRVADWASEGKLPVMMDLPALGTVVPRVEADGTLRSVAYLNCTISTQDNVHLRLRHCPRGAHTRATWKMGGQKDIPLETQWNDSELSIILPPVPGWHMGWVALE